jgi:hypothetical protein
MKRGVITFTLTELEYLLQTSDPTSLIGQKLLMLKDRNQFVIELNDEETETLLDLLPPSEDGHTTPGLRAKLEIILR